MKRKYKHFLFALASAVLLNAISCGTIASAEIETKYGEIVTTINGQHYDGYHSKVSSSYLITEGTGYLRVSKHFSDTDKQYFKLAIEHYNADFKVQSVQYLDGELPLFGGFYSSEDCYYLVFGQENPNESDSTEVIRIVKYDKNWNRLAAASLYGANTTEPFRSGNLRIAEYGGYLYIHTSHTLYKSEDGLNHQCNMTIEVHESDMKIVDSFYDVAYGAGCVGHSFNQFIIVDDEANLVALDHGDAYLERGAILGKYKTKAGNDTFLSGRKCYTSFSILNYKGKTGNNYTGATVGGLEYSDTCYLTVGSSIVQDENYANRKTQNIYVTATKKNSFTKKSTTFSWITNYEENGPVSASAPLLVKRNNNSFLLMWSQLNENYKNSIYNVVANGKFSYVFLDGEGRMVSPIYTQDGYLSDCQPVVNSNGSVIWYALQDGKLSFYQIKEDGSLSVKLTTPTVSSLENVKDGIKVEWQEVPSAVKYRIYRNYIEEEIVSKLSPLADTQDTSTTFIDTTVKEKQTYTYSIKALDSNGNEMHANLDWTGQKIEYEPVVEVSEPEGSATDSSDSVSDDSNTDEDKSSETKPKEKVPLELYSVKIKKNGKKLVAIKGMVSVKDATVKIQANYGKFKKARVTGKKFYLKLVPKVGKYTLFTVKVTKPGYKSIKKYVMY